VATISSSFASTSSAFEASGGYALDMEQDTAYGYTLGVAYEIPEFALRAALTYFSEVEHTSNTTENLLTLSDFVSDVTFHSPQAVNLNFQTGIAQDTLLTANIRWANWGDVDLAPTGLGSDLINLDDSITYSLGIGRRFNENFSGSISVNYEAKGDDNLVSPLGPTDGLLGVTIGGRYKKDNMTVTGGINYTWIGDARPEVGGRAVANFKDNSSVGFGIRVSFAL
jgi:long-subunit fatty acid transport protein